jgi:D-alanyl-D-alanine carboxypeptidase/D-alanyl-D-alanine-endopeptidase (penicillin-binding protein 4)
MIRLHFTLLLCLVAGCSASHTSPATQPSVSSSLESQLRPILHRLDSTGAIVHARVIDLADGRELYSDRADDPAIPASNLKLSISAAALDRFGPDHPVKTFLAMDGDDLWLVGTGDPATGDSKIAAKYPDRPGVLDVFTTALKSHGITRIKGNLYFNAAAFDDTRVHPSWSRSYLVDWYAAPVAGLNYNDNCIDTTVSPAQRGEPAKFEVVPPVANVTIKNKTVSRGGAAAATGADEPAIDRELTKNVFTLTGVVTKKAKLESKAITDPGAFFADALRTHLKTNGITIDGETRRAPQEARDAATRPAEKVVVATYCTPLRDILWRINKNSQNLFAEAMCKYLGRQEQIDLHAPQPQGSWENGSAAVKLFLSGHGVDVSKYVIADGSGLSRQNRITARGQTQLLAAMSRHQYAQAFGESLAVAGKDGTIGKRMDDIKGRVFAKTGYIGGVRALSGYVHTKEGRWLAFSIIYNKIPKDVKPYEALQDEACRAMVNWAP